MKQRRIDAELRRLESIENEKRRREAQRRTDLHNKRVEFLDLQIQRQQRVAQVEAFIDAMAGQEAEGGVVADFIRWSRGFAHFLRRELSHETLSAKLQKLDLMNDEANISRWDSVE
jgi:hypothetical protein